MYYKFASKKDAEVWRNKRSLENRKSKVVEAFMACDQSGLFCHIKYLKLHQGMGILAPLPTCLRSQYAYDEVLKNKQRIKDEDLYDYFQANKKINKPFFRKINSFPVPVSVKTKLKQLTDASGLPESMGELFLNEIKLSTDEANRHLRERAKLLGLM